MVLYFIVTLVTIGAYGLAFWYGTSLVLSGEIEVGDMMTAFFGIIIGAFALGTVSLFHFILIFYYSKLANHTF